jgi:hypothetical protein
MKVTHISLIAVVLVVIAVSLAGCSTTTTIAPPSGGTQAAGSSGGSSPSGTSSGGSGSAVSGAGLFSKLNYDWVEYKIDAGSGMTMYMKQNRKTGICSTRIEGAAAANMPAGMASREFPCKEGSGQASTSVPDAPPSDAKVTCSPIPETVSVPAGTFSATKCTVVSKGMTTSSWIVKDKFVVKTEGSSTEGGSMSMVLNDYAPK